jgi:hypothetical protein
MQRSAMVISIWRIMRQCMCYKLCAMFQETNMPFVNGYINNKRIFYMLTHVGLRRLCESIDMHINGIYYGIIQSYRPDVRGHNVFMVIAL